MAQHFEHFGQQKLTTEFLNGLPFIYRHTYSNHGTPLRVESWARAETLGSGTFGTVYKEACAETKGVRAVKRIERALAKSNELDILTKLRAYPEHFVLFLGWFNDSEYIYLAMEYLPGDLEELMKERDLSEDETKLVTKQILDGLEIMHGEDICHCDLKPGNILVARRIPLRMKIADFGVSKCLDGTQARTTTGTTAFMAPEIWGFGQAGNRTYNTAVDLWSLGCLVYFMFTKCFLFPEMMNLVIFVQGDELFPPNSIEASKLSVPAVSFMASLLRTNPQDRLTASKARLHTWLIIKDDTPTVWSAPSLPPTAIPPPIPTNRTTTARYDAISAQSQANPVLALLCSGPADSNGIDVELAIPAPLLHSRNDSDLDHKPQCHVNNLEHASGYSTSPTRGVKMNQALLAAAKAGICELIKKLIQKGALPMREDSFGETPIHCAARHGHLGAVKTLLENGAEIRAAGSSCLSPLHGAAEFGSSDLVHYLLDKGAVVDERQLDGRTALHIAAAEGHTHIVTILLSKRADLSAKDNDGFTALYRAGQYGRRAVVSTLLDQAADISDHLHREGVPVLLIATWNGHSDVVQLLLHRGVNVDSRMGGSGWNALHITAYLGNVMLMELLLDDGASISTRQNAGRSALHLAVEGGQLDAVQVLYKRGADPLEVVENTGSSLLHTASWFGHSDIVQFLLDNNADISAKMLGGRSALHNASFKGNRNVIRLILARGAPTEKIDDCGFTALYYAISQDHLNAVKLLLRGGADMSKVCRVEGLTALHNAAARGRVEIVNLLLDSGAKISLRTKEDGWNALHIAACEGHPEVLDQLLARGAIISEKDNHGWHALHIAARKGNLAVLTSLLEKGVDVLEKGDANRDALHVAADAGQTQTVKLLLDKGADINNCDNCGLNALHLAAMGDHAEMASLLISRGAKMSIKGDLGYNPLHFAAKRGHLKTVEMLLDCGADVSARSIFAGWTALTFAARHGHLDVARLLVDRGADINDATEVGPSAVHFAAEQGNGDMVKILWQQIRRP